MIFIRANNLGGAFLWSIDLGIIFWIIYCIINALIKIDIFLIRRFYRRILQWRALSAIEHNQRWAESNSNNWNPNINSNAYIKLK